MERSPDANDTKARILDAAEELFAEHGPQGTSLRDITSKAEVNLAAVNYHFQTKEALYHAVVARRIDPLNQYRLKELSRLEKAAEGAALSVEEILHVLISPVMHFAKELKPNHSSFLRLLGRTLYEPAENLESHFIPVFNRFTEVLHKAVPHLTAEQVRARFHFVIGSMVHTMYFLYHSNSSFSSNIAQPENVLADLIKYSAAGFHYGVSEYPNPKRKK